MNIAYRTSLRNSLVQKSNPKSIAWWENYVKDSAPFLGVKMADLRANLHKWYQSEIQEYFDVDKQVALALELFEGEYAEEKLAGILFLQEILLPMDTLGCEKNLDQFAVLFKILISG
jgi:hypothetical protein